MENLVIYVAYILLNSITRCNIAIAIGIGLPVSFGEMPPAVLSRRWEFHRIHSLNSEVLTGDRAGISSVRINAKYRLGFRMRETAACRSSRSV